MPPSGTQRRLRLLATVSFNANHLRSHLEPLISLEEVEAITLVADVAAPLMPKLRCVVPPRLLVRVLGRAGAKLAVCLWVGFRERPDWIVAYNLVPHGINAWIVGSLLRTRVLYHQIGGPVEWLGGGYASDNNLLGRLGRPVRPLEWALLSVVGRSTAVVAMGDRGRRALLQHGVRAERVYLIPGSVNLRRFRPRSDRKVYDAIFVGSLIPSKRPEDLIDAVALLESEGRRLRVAVVGEGPLAASLADRARRASVRGRLDLLGFREDTEALYARSKVFVLPSRYEGLSIAMTEAMACGLPVIVTDVGEVRELVRDGENGFIVAVGAVDALADRLRRLLDDDVLRRSLGAAAAQDAARANVAAAGERYASFLVPAGRGD